MNRAFNLLKEVRWLGPVCCFSLALFISVYSWGPLTAAKWSMIDDHEIVATVGPNGVFSFFDIPSALGNTEISASSTTTRFRPSYYGLRFFEAALWGASPERWFYVRIAIAIAFGFALTIVSLYLAGPILSFGFLTFALSRPYWVDIFARLGPAETYVVLGFCFTILGLAAGIIRGWSIAACLALALGIIIAAGSKENFLILAVLPIWLLGSKSIRLSPGKKALFAVVLVYLSWIGFTIVRRLQATGLDIYSQDISLSSRTKLISSFLMRPDVQLWLAVIITFVLVVGLIRIFNSKKEDEPTSLLIHSLDRDALILLMLLFFFASQYLFYSGKWPETSNARYLFPGKLSEHLAILVSVTALVKVSNFKPNQSSWSWALPLFASACFIGYSLDDFANNRIASQKFVGQSREFTSKLDVSFGILRSSPSHIVVLNSHSFFDYEPIFAMQRFIRSAGLSNPIVIKMNGYSSAGLPSDVLSVQLTKAIEGLQKDGGRGFTSLQAVEPSKGCFSFGMHGAPSIDCKTGITIYP